ncbi:hypothetical protein [Aurantiacibacter luteus]|uniref:Uncharacterized protein n=1 Tax=Aurantiacibacter luteus TaxID=1581420 RepID=A0A0G9MXJ3_9SPHN|nr:hypothetical protein [Aurantiacibacter luteus]KLE35456.1 hypothetical protein AAW00_03235 [Aurantiacibacter luteus]
MRAALISLPRPEEGEAEVPAIAGKSVAERQLLFAKACGCTAAIAFGGGASAAAVALRHAAEREDMRFQVISSAHALPGAIADDDSLMVFQPAMLPEARQALDLLRAEGERMLIVSAGPGTSAGFERIDLDRAWAGAMTIPGKWLGRLISLPEDAAPHAALLRIALQMRLPEARLDQSLLDDGRWMVVRDAASAQRREATWLRSHLGDTPPTAPSRWLAQRIVVRAGGWLMDRPFARPMLAVLSMGLLGGALAAAFNALPVVAFALTALAVPTIESFLALSRLAVAPFGAIGRLPWLRRIVDLTLLAIGVLAIEGEWQRALFPPLVLGTGLLLLDRDRVPTYAEPLRDQALVALLVAAVAALTTPEMAIMLAGVLVIGANLLPRGGEG